MTSQNVIVVAEHMNGELSDTVPQAITLGRDLADKLGGQLVVVLIAGNADLSRQTNRQGVDVVYHARNAPEPFDPAIYAAVVLAAAEKYQPRIVIIPHSVNGISYAPAVAVGVNAGLAMDVFKVDATSERTMVTRSGYAGKVWIEVGFPQSSMAIVTLRSGAFPPTNIHGSAIVEECTEEVQIEDRLLSEHVAYLSVPESEVDISAAKVIFSVGRGVGDQMAVERVARLATAAGAALGCSRPVVDAGWLPKAHQVGQSGNVARSCELYIALGISGAVQHLYGMKHIKTIIAVNKDPRAQIFDFATIGVCMDVGELIGALERQI